MSWCEAVWITIHISIGCCGIDNLMWRSVKWLETCPFGNRFLSWDFRFSRRRVWTLQPSALCYTVGFSRSCHMRWILYGSVCQIFVYILRSMQTMYLRLSYRTFSITVCYLTSSLENECTFDVLIKYLSNSMEQTSWEVIGRSVCQKRRLLWSPKGIRYQFTFYNISLFKILTQYDIFLFWQLINDDISFFLQP
jgi:hypothetical protein